jgi:DNA repair protein RadA/Sms
LIRFKPFIPIISNRPQEVYPKFETTAELIKFAKETNIPVILIGHITKDETLPAQYWNIWLTPFYSLKATITCTAFCVPLKSIWFHSRNWHLRNVRSGLREVSNPSILISHKDEELGTAIASTLEGMRPLMIEIQSLVSTAVYGTPQRSTTLTPRD